MSDYTYLDFYRPHWTFGNLPEITELSDSKTLSICCPWHEDNHPSAGLFIETGWIHCFTCNNSWSPVDFLIEQVGMDPDEAITTVEVVRAENDLVKNFETTLQRKQPIYSKEFEHLYKLSLEHFSIDRPAVSEYIRSRGITLDTLRECGIGCLPAEYSPYGNELLVFPYMDSGKIIGLRYRDAAGNKWAQKDSYFCLGGLDKFEDVEDLSEKTLVICEGETDRLRATQAIKACDKENYFVVSLPGARWEDGWNRAIQGFGNIIMVCHDDKPSKNLVGIIRRNIPAVEVLHLPWTRKQPPSMKDLADWSRYHTDEEILVQFENCIKKKPRKILTFSEFKIGIGEAREYLIDNFLSRNQIISILGKPKGMKSWVAINMVRSLLTGENFLGLPQLSVSSDIDRNKILFWEEEGADKELLERFELVLEGIPEEDLNKQLLIAHQLGASFNCEEDMELISKKITDEDIDLVIFDPFSRMLKGVDEDSASEMGSVWSRIANLQTRHKRTSFIIIHHTTKSSTLETSGLESSRGSSRFAAEIDGGIMVEKVSEKNTVTKEVNNYLKVKFDGRWAPIEATDGNPIFKLKFDHTTGLFHEHTQYPSIRGKGVKLVRLLEEKGRALSMDEIAMYTNNYVTPAMIVSWIATTVWPQTGQQVMEWNVKNQTVSIGESPI